MASLTLKRPSALIDRLSSAFRWVTHPITVFIILQIIWTAITILWVIWFVEATEEIEQLAKSFGAEKFDSRYALAMLIVGCILLGMLLVGTITLFVSSLRQRKMIEQQKSFVSSVTHELRSPLSSLQLAFETMRSRKLDSDTSDRMMTMALADIERLSRLVNAILISAQLDKGIVGFDLEKEIEIVSLCDLIKKAVAKSEWLDPDIVNRVKVDCPEDLETQSARPILVTIVSNLIENAVKYSPPGSPIEVTVTTSHNQYTIGVKDKGFGLEKYDQKRIFRMFYRGKVTSKKAITGTGLGLFMVKTLSQMLGGTAWVESEGRSHGSTFYVTLPKKM